MPDRSIQSFRDLDAWLSGSRLGTGAKRDDVLDACAVAIAVRDVAERIPATAPPIDAYRLPMQIWF